MMTTRRLLPQIKAPPHSDIANGIAEELFGWRCISSGGSIDDHKKNIARGGWESVKRHFREIGIDCQTTDFTVAGDMAGDVFGNGMLLSDIALIAALNYLHILRPSPDAAASYKERQGRSENPSLSWEDYDSKLIRKAVVYLAASKLSS